KPARSASASRTETATGGGWSGMLAGLPPTPELIAQVEALPPARDEPDVGADFARSAAPRFTLRRLLRPFMVALVAGLVLDGVDALATFLQTGLISIVSSVLSFFGIVIALLIINLRLGLLVLSVMPVLVVATLVYRAKSSLAYQDAREKVSAVNADLQENVAGMRVTQAYRREGRNRARFADRSDAYRL